MQKANWQNLLAIKEIGGFAFQHPTKIEVLVLDGIFLHFVYSMEGTFVKFLEPCAHMENYALCLHL